MKEKLNICVVGAGYWGKNIVRVLHEHGALYAVCDIDSKKLVELRKRYEFKPYTSLEEALKDNEINGFAIAVPPSSLDEIALNILKNGRHTFVEKPVALSSKKMETLIKVAEREKAILMGGYTLMYNDALSYVKNWLNEKKPKTYYVHSERLNLGIIREDVNVWWNLAPHDISILHFIFQEMPCEIKAWGTSFIKKKIEDVVLAELTYESGLKAFIHVSWIDPCKVRKTTFVCDKGLIEFDDTKQDDKVRILKRREERIPENGMGNFSSYGEFQAIVRAGETIIPSIRIREPLSVEMGHFLECIKENKKPLTNGDFSLDVVRVLEGGTKALLSGRPVRLWKK